MKNPNLAFERKAFVSNSVTERFISEIMEIRGATSRSQIIRDALFEYRKSTKGLYLEPSINESLKIDKLTQKRQTSNLTDEEYATNVIKAYVTTSPNSGERLAVIHWFHDSINALPVAGCKAWTLDIVENHKKINATTPIEEKIKEKASGEFLHRKYGIIISTDESDEPDDKSDT